MKSIEELGEILMQKVKTLKNQNRQLVSKRVVSYLLAEVIDLVENNRMAVHRYPKDKREAKLFELSFTLTGLCVHTIHKFGAMKIKFIKECKASDAEQTIKDIQEMSRFIGLEVVFARGINQSTKKLDIVWNIQEDETP